MNASVISAWPAGKIPGGTANPPVIIAAIPTRKYRSCSVPQVPAIDDGLGTNPVPGPPTHHKPGPAPQHAAGTDTSRKHF